VRGFDIYTFDVGRARAEREIRRDSAPLLTFGDRPRDIGAMSPIAVPRNTARRAPRATLPITRVSLS